MNLHQVLLPVFIEVGLIMVLAGLMATRRLSALRAGAVRREDVVVGQKNWPDAAQRASNAFSNQFELPVLFFALVPLALFTHKADAVFVVLAWIFVLSRIVHAAAYVTSNPIVVRFTAYLVGAVALAILWIQFAIRILAIPLPA